ncbi:MAG: long-chain fatty acid--CoA ligase [Proteobacteria bacterium]|nr:long-chain fatty acid--CoA ligase [Pseudomonadota bacterium]
MQRYALTVDKFLDHAAKWHGTACVVSRSGAGGTERIEYRQLRERCRRVSGAMLDQGLRRGDRIATLAWNTQDHLTLYYAAMGVGLVCHTLNPRLSVAHLAEMVQEAQDRWIAVGVGLQPLARQLLAACPGLEAVILLDGQQPEEDSPRRVRQWSLEELLRACGRPALWGDFEEETPAGLCYTSGTIGKPRGVLYTHRSNYLHTIRALQADAVALTAEDSVLVAVPMFHANGWGFPFAAPAVGAKMVLPGRSTDPVHLHDLIVSEGVTVAAAVQTVWLGLVEHLEETGGRLPTLGRIIIGGSSCPDALLRRIEEGLQVRVQTSWGMTELSPLGTIEPPNIRPRPDSRASGRLPMGLDLKLVDADGKALPEQRMRVGRLMVKGASVAERYFNEPEPALDAEGYFDTGDLALIDENGNVAITGRTKDLIKSGGEWINPREIEDIVGALPQVGLVAVVGQPHEKWGERPVLVVEPCNQQSIDRETLLGALRGKVPDWWLPERIELVQKMPLAATGKIDKKCLRAQFAAAG